MTENISWMSKYGIEILALVYLIGMILYGHHRGFIKIAVSMTAIIITLVLVNIALPHVSSFLRNNTAIESSIKNKILYDAGLDTIAKDSIESANEQQKIIEGLPIQKDIKKILSKNNNISVWQSLGVNYFADYLGSYLSNIVFNVLSFVILFVIIWLLLQIFLHLADIFTKLPVIHGMNQIIGAVLGLVQGLVYIWIICLAVSGLAFTPLGIKAMEIISKSAILSFLFEYNLLSVFLKSLVYSIL